MWAGVTCDPQQQWEYLEEALGAPCSAVALELSRAAPCSRLGIPGRSLQPRTLAVPKPSARWYRRHLCRAGAVRWPRLRIGGTGGGAAERGQSFLRPRFTRSSGGALLSRVGASRRLLLCAHIAAREARDARRHRRLNVPEHHKIAFKMSVLDAQLLEFLACVDGK